MERCFSTIQSVPCSRLCRCSPGWTTMLSSSQACMATISYNGRTCRCLQHDILDCSCHHLCQATHGDLRKSLAFPPRCKPVGGRLWLLALGGLEWSRLLRGDFIFLCLGQSIESHMEARRSRLVPIRFPSGQRIISVLRNRVLWPCPRSSFIFVVTVVKYLLSGTHRGCRYQARPPDESRSHDVMQL